MRKRYWVSWIGDENFELHSPWWRSGYSGDGEKVVFCAAVISTSEAAAKRAINNALDSGYIEEWRFFEEKENDWSPFNDRFRRADWMVWP